MVIPKRLLCRGLLLVSFCALACGGSGVEEGDVGSTRKTDEAEKASGGGEGDPSCDGPPGPDDGACLRGDVAVALSSEGPVCEFRGAGVTVRRPGGCSEPEVDGVRVEVSEPVLGLPPDLKPLGPAVTVNFEHLDGRLAEIELASEYPPIITHGAWLYIGTDGEISVVPTNDVVGLTVEVNQSGRYVAVNVDPPPLEGCDDRTVVLSEPLQNQAQVEALRGVSRITGGLSLSADATVESLEPLACLRVVGSVGFGGEFQGVVSLPGLAMADFFLVESTHAVSIPAMRTAFRMFIAAPEIDAPLMLRVDSLSLQYTRRLRTPMLGQLWSLSVEYSGLESIEQFSFLRQAIDVFVRANEELTDVSGLRGLVEVIELQIDNSPKLVEVDLPNLVAARDLLVSTTSRVSLENLVEVEGSLWVAASDVAVPRLERAGALGIRASAVNFESLRTVTDSLDFCGPYLTDAEFPSLESLGWFGCVDAPLLESIDLSNLRNLGRLDAEEMPMLRRLTIPRLERVTESVTFRSSPSLVDLDLGVLGEIGGSFSLGGSGLETLDGLSSLRTVGEDVSIHGNPRLRNVTSLYAIQQIGGSLDLHDNEVLHELGFEQLTSLGWSFQVTGNPSLRTCDVVQLRDQLIEAGWSGHVVIADNGVDECSRP